MGQTKIASDSNSRYILLEMSKVDLRLNDCSNILYSVNDSYPRGKLVRPWFQFSDDDALYVGLETGKSCSLNAFADIFVNGDRLIRFPVVKARILPEPPSLPKRVDLVKTIRDSLLPEKTSPVIGKWHARYEIAKGVKRVIFNCRKSASKCAILACPSLKNTTAHLRHQMKLLDLANHRLFLGEDCELDEARGLEQLLSFDDKYFPGPLFFYWFFRTGDLAEPVHELENTFPINIRIKRSLREGMISFVYTDGRFSLKANEESMIFRHGPRIIICYQKEMLSEGAVDEAYRVIDEACRLLSGFLGWGQRSPSFSSVAQSSSSCAFS